MILEKLKVQTRIQNSDIKAFEEVYKQYYTPLCLYVRSILNDMDTAEEIVQEFFFFYWENRKSIGIKMSLKSYLYQSVKNRALKYLRHLEVQRKHAEKSVYYRSQISDTDTSKDYEVKELQKIIQDILDELPEKSRLIFKMSRYEGMKYKEIALELSVSQKTVEVHMGKVLKIFRDKLIAYKAKDN